MIHASANTTVVITIAPSINGVLFIPSTIFMRVEGSLGIIQDWINLIPISNTPVANVSLNIVASNTISSLVINIPNVFNLLPSSANQDPRLISLNLDGHIQFAEYIIISDAALTQPLVIMNNSFQTYPQSLLFVDSIPDMKAWPNATLQNRVRAMEQAYFFLSRLNYEIYYDRDDIYFKNRASWGLPYINTIGNLYNYTVTDFLNLDAGFLKSIYSAQVVEADERLGADTISDMREDGVIQHTVGDTSATFRQTTPLRLSVSKRALKYLHGYIKYSPRTTRS